MTSFIAHTIIPGSSQKIVPFQRDTAHFNVRTLLVPSQVPPDPGPRSNDERIRSPRTVRSTPNETQRSIPPSLPSKLAAAELKEHGQSIGLYGIGMKINIEAPHFVKQVTDLQDEFGNSLNEEVQVGDILVQIDQQPVQSLEIDALERVIFGERDSIITIILKPRQGAHTKQLRVRRHVLVKTLESCRRCFEIKDELKGRPLVANPMIVKHLDQIRLSICDGLGYLLDLMSDDDSALWNNKWEAIKPPASSLGIIFEQHSDLSPGPVQIHGVVAGSPADLLGQLKGNDEILAVDGCIVDSRNVKQKLRGQDAVGTFCNVLIRRGNSTFEVQLQRTTATHIFTLGQLFDLLASHEMLTTQGADQHDLLLSLQAIHFQILTLERLRLQRESCLAANIHSIQNKIFDRVIAALSSLTGSLDVNDDNVAPTPDQIEHERSRPLERSHGDGLQNALVSNGNLDSTAFQTSQVEGTLPSSRTNFFEHGDGLGNEVTRLKTELDASAQKLARLNTQQAIATARIRQMTENLVESQALLCAIQEHQGTNFAMHENLQHKLESLACMQGQLDSKESMINHLRNEVKQLRATVAQLKEESKVDQECVTCLNAELHECATALAELQQEVGSQKRKEVKLTDEIQKLVDENCQLKNVTQEAKQKEDDRIILLGHECNSLKVKICEAEKESKTQALALASFQRRRDEEVEVAATCRRQLAEIRAEYHRATLQIQRFEKQMQALLLCSDKKSVIGLEVQNSPPFRVLHVPELMDEDGNLRDDAVCVGDELIGIDGAPASSLTAPELVQKLSGLPGTLVVLDLRSDLVQYSFTAQRHVQITADRSEITFESASYKFSDSSPRRGHPGPSSSGGRFTSSYSAIPQAESSTLHRESPRRNNGSPERMFRDSAPDDGLRNGGSPRTPSARDMFSPDRHSGGRGISGSGQPMPPLPAEMLCRYAAAASSFPPPPGTKAISSSSFSFWAEASPPTAEILSGSAASFPPPGGGTKATSPASFWAEVSATPVAAASSPRSPPARMRDAPTVAAAAGPRMESPVVKSRAAGGDHAPPHGGDQDYRERGQARPGPGVRVAKGQSHVIQVYGSVAPARAGVVSPPQVREAYGSAAAHVYGGGAVVRESRAAGAAAAAAERSAWSYAAAADSLISLTGFSAAVPEVSARGLTRSGTLPPSAGVTNL